MQGAAKRVRPVMMTALTAILGLLPAALSTQIGAPDAAAAGHRGGRRHDTTLFVDRYLMPVLYSFYGHREPPAGWRQPGTLSTTQNEPRFRLTKDLD